MDLNILFEDSHILVCEKPAGIPTQTKDAGIPDMSSIIINYLFRQKNGENQIPYLGLVHRLDQPVGGIMVFAKNQKSASILCQQVAKKQIKKQYVAVITNDLSLQKKQSPTLLTDYMITDKQKNTSKIVKTKNTQTKTANLTYQVLSVIPYESIMLSLIKIDLLTGRHHQIRLQTAEHLGGIWGDKKYNPLFQTYQKQTKLALYSCHLQFQHPISGKNMSFTNFPKFDVFNLFSFE